MIIYDEIKNKKVWFKISELQNKVGTVNTYLGEGLFQVVEEESGKIYHCLFTEMKVI
jgi:hypothetical protein